MLEYLGSHISILQELLIKLNILGIKSLFSLEQCFWNMSHNHKLKKNIWLPSMCSPSADGRWISFIVRDFQTTCILLVIAYFKCHLFS